MNYDAELYDWRVYDDMGVFRLTGRIFNDKKGRFADDEKVYTSAVRSIDFEAGIAVTRNTTYLLKEG